ncbi:uncharacterized protein N7506_000001 [Penicillium brevicompactum]|uniref:uncharacterized protein n=1 Tax=Penicillium brevicompactum TaxID=5074 RepID=UPI00253FAE28|nr:uncharacterized protein N7506_000001 [Penicillium brevicompactum]KAJ5346748.1 hypothetical protein N7506_000001 [Penicillium brevicompactum]
MTITCDYMASLVLPRDPWLSSSRCGINKPLPISQYEHFGARPWHLASPPPGSVPEAPLTPPSTEQKPLSRSARSVVTCLRLHRANHRPSSWWERRLRPDDYTEVLRVLHSDENLRNYVEDKIRYDYDPCRYCLTIRMPSLVHDTFCARIVDEIIKQLRQFQETDGPLADFAKQVEHFATSRIFIPEDTHDVSISVRGHRFGKYP